MNHPSEFAALFKLPLEERQRLADELLESIEAEQEAAAIPEAVVAELFERKARFDANPASGVSWSEAERRLRED